MKLNIWHLVMRCMLNDEVIIDLSRWAKGKSVDKYGITRHESFLIDSERTQIYYMIVVGGQRIIIPRKVGIVIKCASKMP